MTTLLLAEQWLSEKAREGNPHAQAIRAEMDRLRALVKEPPDDYKPQPYEKPVVYELNGPAPKVIYDIRPEHPVTGQVEGKPFRGYVVQVME